MPVCAGNFMACRGMRTAGPRRLSADRPACSAFREIRGPISISPDFKTLRAFDNNLRTPYIQNWNLTIQRELPHDFTLDVRYVGSKGTKLLRSVDTNEVNIFENGLLDAFVTTQHGGNATLLNQLFNGFN